MESKYLLQKKGKKMVLVKRRTKRIKESVKDLLKVQTKIFKERERSYNLERR